MRGLGGERPRDADPLPLAAGELAGQAVAMTRAVSWTRSSSSSTRAVILSEARAEQLRRDGDILGDAQMREQPAVLEDVADAAAQLHRIGRKHVLALDRDVAAVGVDQPVDEPEQGGLAGAGTADDGEELAFGDLKRHVVHGDDAFRAAVETLHYMGVGDHRRGWHVGVALLA